MKQPLFPLQAYRTPQQVADYLKISRREVYRLVYDGPLEAEEVGGRLRIHSSALRKLQLRQATQKAKRR